MTRTPPPLLGLTTNGEVARALMVRAGLGAKWNGETGVLHAWSPAEPAPGFLPSFYVTYALVGPRWEVLHITRADDHWWSATKRLRALLDGMGAPSEWDELWGTREGDAWRIVTHGEEGERPALTVLTGGLT